MTKLKGVNKIHNLFVDHINELDIQLQNQINKIKKEYNNNLSNEQNKLIMAICHGECEPIILCHPLWHNRENLVSDRQLNAMYALQSKMKNKKVGEKKNNFDITQIRNITKSVKKELNECINN